MIEKLNLLNTSFKDRNFSDFDDFLDNGIINSKDISNKIKIAFSIFRSGKIIEEGFSRKLFDRYNISLVQFNILMIIYFSKDKNLSQVEISKKLFTSKANISVILNKMQINGLILKKENKLNRREKRISLTKKGNDVLNKIFKLFSCIITENKLLSFKEEEMLLMSLTKIRKKFKEMGDN